MKQVIQDTINSALKKFFNIWSVVLACLCISISVQGMSIAEDSQVVKPGNEQKIKRLGLKRSGSITWGKASWYGDYFHGRETANQEIFNKNLLTAAHKTLPFNTYLLVTNLKNNKQVIVRVNDRGPYIAGRQIDLSEAAAKVLGGYKKGVMSIKYEILS